MVGFGIFWRLQIHRQMASVQHCRMLMLVPGRYPACQNSKDGRYLLKRRKTVYAYLMAHLEYLAKWMMHAMNSHVFRVPRSPTVHSSMAWR